MHISIIIVHYNSAKETLECLDSLLKLKTQIKHAITIVDNGSLEPLSIPSHLDKEHVVLLRSESNLGFTGGNNLGTYKAVEKYNSDYILYLNNDTTVAPNLLDALHLAAQPPQVGMVCPNMYFYPGDEFHNKSYQSKNAGSVFWYAGGFIDWRNFSAGHIGVDEVDVGQFNTVRETEFISGCCMLIKREVLEKVSPFDKRFFLYFEDTDLSLRVKNAGYQLLITPKTHIWHKNAGSSGGSGSKLQQYYQTRNKLLFFFLHGSSNIRLRVIKYAFQLYLFGSKIEKKAVWHWLTLQFGKQPLV